MGKNAEMKRGAGFSAGNMSAVRVIVASGDSDFVVELFEVCRFDFRENIEISGVFCGEDTARILKRSFSDLQELCVAEECADAEFGAEREFLGSSFVASKFDASDIIKEIRQDRGAVLVLGTDLRGIDSLFVAEELERWGLSDNIILVSWFYSVLQKRLAEGLGLGYCFCLPVDIRHLCRRILECGAVLRNCVSAQKALFSHKERRALREEGESLAGKTTKLLHDIGVPANLCGHDYLRDAVLMTMDGGEVYGKMTKIIYPKIALKYDKSPSSVEKAIRTALDIAWVRGKVDLLNEIFGFTVSVQKGKPTNSEFIALLADYIQSQA